MNTRTDIGYESNHDGSPERLAWTAPKVDTVKAGDAELNGGNGADSAGESGS